MGLSIQPGGQVPPKPSLSEEASWKMASRFERLGLEFYLKNWLGDSALELDDASSYKVLDSLS